MTRRSAGLWLRELPALLCTPGDGTVALGAVPAPPFPSPRPQREQASVCTVACTLSVARYRVLLRQTVRYLGYASVFLLHLQICCWT